MGNEEKSSVNLSSWVIGDTKKSGIDESILNEMGISEPSDLKSILGFDELGNKKIGATYSITYPDGFIRVKLQNQIENAKYLSPKDQPGKHIYYLSKEKENLQSCKYSVILTEGEKKTAKLTQECRKLDYVTALGSPGIGMFPIAPEDKKLFTSILQRISERIFYIALDTDFSINPDVQNAIAKLTFFLSSYGAIPKLMIWNSNYKGIDDYLASVPNPEIELKKLLDSAIENPFRHLRQLSIEKVAKIIIELGINSDKAEILFEKYELKTVFNITKAMFKKLLKAQAQLIIIADALPSPEFAKNDEIYEEKKKTWIVKCSKGKEGTEYYPVEIAAFVANVKRKIVTDEGLVSWEIEVETEKEKEIIEVDGPILSEIASFRKAIMQRGCFLYNITDTPTHNRYISFLMEKSNFSKVKKTLYLGKLDQQIYAFNNAIVTPLGVQENKFYILPKGKMLLFGNREVIKKAFEMVERLLGNQAWKFFGFLMGTLFCNEIADRFSYFPILFFRGEKGSGKSRLAEILACFFGIHRDVKPFTITSTVKSQQRTASKFKGIPLRLNEYQATPVNNTLLCSYFDREGQNRSKTDNTLDTKNIEVNTSFIVLSTHNITGYKAEDVLSRIIEIDTNNLNHDSEAMAWLWENREKLSWFVVEGMKIGSKDILDKIQEKNKESIEKTKEDKIEDRCIDTHSLIYACATFIEKITQKEIKLDECTYLTAMKEQTKTVKTIDVAYSFLQSLNSLVLKEEVPETIAQIVENPNAKDVKGGNYLVFSLRNALPLVQRFSKQSERAFADEKTLAQRFQSLGLISQICRILGKLQTCWFYKLEEIQEEEKEKE